MDGSEGMESQKRATGNIVIADFADEDEHYHVARSNGTNDWLMTFTLAGEGCFRTPLGVQPCRVGDLTIMRPGVPHQYGTVHGQRWHFAWVHFTQRMPEIDLLDIDELYHHTFDHASARERVFNAFQRLVVDARQQNTYWVELCLNALREVVIMLLQRTTQQRDARIEEVLFTISQNLHEPIQIAALAQSVGLSTSRLSHLFKEQTGQSIISKVNEMRIVQATLLMQHTKRSATEICYDVGFQNYNHFSNQFRKYHHMSPTQYMTTYGSPYPE